MKFGIFACALGRHRIDERRVQRVHGQQVARCRNCSTALELRGRDEWVPVAVRDAGLSHRILR